MCYSGCSAENNSGNCTLSTNYYCDEYYDETTNDEPPEEYFLNNYEIDKIHDRYEAQFD